MEVRIEGQRELIKSLRRVNGDLPKELTGIHRELAEPIAADASSRAPQLSGRLAGSIRAQSGQRYARVAAGGRSVPYAGPIHWGWPARNIAPQEFLVDALEANEAATVDRYVELVDEFLDRVWETIPA